MIRIFLDSLPQAKKRHRSAIRHGRVFTYDPQSSEKTKIKWDAASQLRELGLLKPLEGAISLSIKSFHPFPKSWSKKRVKSEKEKGGWKTSKPDVDNICKMYKDVLTGIAYKDDAQVVQLWSEKIYSDKPGIEIILSEKRFTWSMNTQ